MVATSRIHALFADNGFECVRDVAVLPGIHAHRIALLRRLPQDGLVGQRRVVQIAGGVGRIRTGHAVIDGRRAAGPGNAQLAGADVFNRCSGAGRGCLYRFGCCRGGRIRGRLGRGL